MADEYMHSPPSIAPQRAFESKDLYVYCGHGDGGRYLAGEELQRLPRCPATILMGCSSGVIKTQVGCATRPAVPYRDHPHSAEFLNTDRDPTLVARCPTLAPYTGLHSSPIHHAGRADAVWNGAELLAREVSCFGRQPLGCYRWRNRSFHLGAARKLYSTKQVLLPGPLFRSIS